MAVRHGYGKIVTDGLVFAYDTGDTVNSYKGEPTENLAVNPTFNSTSNWNKVSNDTSSTFTTSNNYGKITVASGNYYVFLRQTLDIPTVSGDTYTLSFKVKNNTTGQFGIRLVYYSSVYETTNVFSLDGTGGERTYSTTFTTNRTNPQILIDILAGEYYPEISSSVNFLEFTNAQLEKKSHATPFVNGTRSATQGLLDLTGNTSIDLTNAGFDSNAQLDFDGTSNFILPGIDTPQNPLTVSIWFNQHSLQGRAHLLGNYQSAIFKGANFSTKSKKILWYMYGPGVYGFGNLEIPGTDYNLNVWNNVVYWNDGLEYKVYLNGELKASIVDSGWAQVPNLSIGANHDYNFDFFDGKIDVVKIYNRALTSAEIQNNYRHYKTRFGI